MYASSSAMPLEAKKHVCKWKCSWSRKNQDIGEDSQADRNYNIKDGNHVDADDVEDGQWD
jgi:hypothetical protein